MSLKSQVEPQRNNIRLNGILELPTETWDMTEQAVKKALSEKLEFSPSEINSMNIERGHRVRDSRPGRQDRTSSDGSRQIVVKFNSFKSRDNVLKACCTMKPNNLYGS